jgi:hypothetical protein
MADVVLSVYCSDTDSVVAHRQVTDGHVSKDSETERQERILRTAESEGPQDEAEFRILLGRATWRLLHTMAARYPEKADELRIQRTEQFIDLLSHLFPCPKCAAHMRVILANDKPQLGGQKEFSNWLCNIHNKVNLRLGKPEFPCENVDDRYDCGCDIGEDDGTDIGPAVKPIRPWDTRKHQDKY